MKASVPCGPPTHRLHRGPWCICWPSHMGNGISVSQAALPKPLLRGDRDTPGMAQSQQWGQVWDTQRIAGSGHGHSASVAFPRKFLASLTNTEHATQSTVTDTAQCLLSMSSNCSEPPFPSQERLPTQTAPSKTVHPVCNHPSSLNPPGNFLSLFLFID